MIPYPSSSTIRTSIAVHARRLAVFVSQSPPRGFFLALRLLAVFVLLALLIAVHASLLAIHPYQLAAERYDITEVSRYRTGCELVDPLGHSLGRIFASNLDPVSMEDLPPHLVNALIATEDAKFFRHSGADLLAILRAAIINFRRSEIAQGASTITQQLARSVYQMDERTFERKLLELLVARRIEQHYSKNEILEQYLNRVYFGNGSWGIGAAARDYFGKPVQELTMEESALLVGVIKRPVGFSPYLNPAAARQARDHTLLRMEKLGFLTPEDGKHFRAIPMRLQPRSDRANAPHYLLDHVEHETRLILQKQQLPPEGYVVHTSADLVIQNQVRRAIADTLPGIEALLRSTPPGSRTAQDTGAAAPAGDDSGPLQVAAVLIQNRTGRILASEGGRNYEQSQFNRVYQARRQPGSCFLALVYAAVFNQPNLGPRTLTLDTALDNRKVMIGGQTGVLGEWGSERLETVYEGEIPAAYAFFRAKNAASVRLGTRVGIDVFCDLAREAGIESELKRYPSTFLGASELTLLELSRAFTIFPNGGRKPAPASLVDYITKPDGTLVYERPRPPESLVVSQSAAAQVTRILQASLYTSPESSTPDDSGLCSKNLAGKSGTVHGFTDAWFVGFDGEVTCGVWVGYDQPRPLSSEGFGRKLAMPVWAGIMNALGCDASLPPMECFDAHGQLFCEFHQADSQPPQECSCLLHRPRSSVGVVLQTTTPPRELPQPVRPQVPVLSGEDPYRSAWPAGATPE